jgi:hypothetical protein
MSPLELEACRREARAAFSSELASGAICLQ